MDPDPAIETLVELMEDKNAAQVVQAFVEDPSLLHYVEQVVNRLIQAEARLTHIKAALEWEIEWADWMRVE